MNWVVSIYLAVLFYILTPGILLRIPKKGSVFFAAGVHAVVFTIVYYLTVRYIWKLNSTSKCEGLNNCTTPQCCNNNFLQCIQNCGSKGSDDCFNQCRDDYYNCAANKRSRNLDYDELDLDQVISIFKTNPSYHDVSNPLSIGQSFSCNSNDIGAGGGAVYRYRGDSVASYYPTPQIAVSWDKNWANPIRIDCQGLKWQGNMGMK